MMQLSTSKTQVKNQFVDAIPFNCVFWHFIELHQIQHILTQKKLIKNKVIHKKIFTSELVRELKDQEDF